MELNDKTRTISEGFAQAFDTICAMYKEWDAAVESGGLTPEMIIEAQGVMKVIEATATYSALAIRDISQLFVKECANGVKPNEPL